MKKQLVRLLPPFVLFVLLEIRDWVVTGNSHRYYSQFGEDIILERLVPPKGFYVDIGAYHPKRNSNTYRLFKKGWRGMNVDANPFAISLFKFWRPGDINVHCGAGEKGKQTLYLFTDGKYDTFSKSQADMVHQSGKSFLVETREVQIVPLSELFAAHHVVHIDLLSIDAECMDLEVLKTNDWATVVPDVLLVESHQVDFDALTQDPFYSFLRGNGYRLKGCAGYTLIFKHDKHHHSDI